MILSANGATLKLDNQKNGQKSICIHHEANGDDYFCTVNTLACWFLHIQGQASYTANTFLSAYFVKGEWFHVTDKNIHNALKWVAEALDYPITKGNLIKRVNTHSLCSGGSTELSLLGFSETEIQKMGQ